jgi:hypothetical protein
MKKSLAASAIEAVCWIAAGLVFWLAPESYRPLAQGLVVLAFVVSVASFLMSRRRLRDAEAAVALKKRELEELRKKQG